MKIRVKIKKAEYLCWNELAQGGPSAWRIDKEVEPGIYRIYWQGDFYHYDIAENMCIKSREEIPDNYKIYDEMPIR